MLKRARTFPSFAPRYDCEEDEDDWEDGRGYPGDDDYSADSTEEVDPVVTRGRVFLPGRERLVHRAIVQWSPASDLGGKKVLISTSGKLDFMATIQRLAFYGRCHRSYLPVAWRYEGKVQLGSI